MAAQHGGGDFGRRRSGGASGRPEQSAPVACGLLATVIGSMILIGMLTDRAHPVLASMPADADDATVFFPAKLKVLRAGVREGVLEVVFSITGRATGSITIDYQAAGRFHRMVAGVGPPQEGEKRVTVLEPLGDGQRAARSGIINAAFAGNSTTQADAIRLRAGKGRSQLRFERLTFADGRLSIAGTINSRVSGVVRLRASYRDSDGTIGVWTARVAAAKGAWNLDEKLPAPATADPNAYLSIQFTGQENAVGGPYGGEQLGKSLGNLVDMTQPSPSEDEEDQFSADGQAGCDGEAEDECAEEEENEEP